MAVATKQMFDHESLKRAVLDYLSECDSPVPDAVFRRFLRNKLRDMVGSPAEPKPR